MPLFELDDHLPADFRSSALRADVRAGLTAAPKVLPPKWFYDERGSELFERITELPEYYPTRAERAILTERASEIAALTRAVTLVELGAGSATKTRLLLSALREEGPLRRYVPVDVSAAMLAETGRALSREYAGLSVHAVAADFEHHLEHLPRGGRGLTAFLGGTIGNFEPADRARFLAAVRESVAAGDWLLLGTDLVKDPSVLVPAYDDAAGITADFNRNVLYVINQELKADFDPASFEHVAVWDRDREWIEMRLTARQAHEVRLAELDLTVTFEAGEHLRTEISAKFRQDGVREELAAAGFTLVEWWTDRDRQFAVSLSRAVPAGGGSIRSTAMAGRV
ncbi:MAG: L-histidine N(alpha)-methyltransferase [Actinobacteria bacterium]|nr:L-histidine N(alpha)-methyltransferase [Actinomycetota bacterium]